jgi:hypothetical protein
MMKSILVFSTLCLLAFSAHTDITERRANEAVTNLFSIYIS